MPHFLFNFSDLHIEFIHLQDGAVELDINSTVPVFRISLKHPVPCPSLPGAQVYELARNVGPRVRNAPKEDKIPPASQT